MSEYAYVRVSTRDQNIDRQLAAHEPYRLPEENIFCDYESGKNFDRPALPACARLSVPPPETLTAAQSARTGFQLFF